MDGDDSGHKILVIGPPKAGKTCFVTRYVHGVFSAIYKQTFGVDFALKHLERNGRPITLQLWDIAGQERTQSLTRMYYQDAHACVIMFDLTNGRSLEICNKWKADLDMKCTLDNGEPIPCILLANKADLTKDRKFTTENIASFSKENNYIGFFETSVKTNTNIIEAMDFLVDCLLEKENDLPHSYKDPSLPDLLDEPRKTAEKSKCCS